MRRWLLGVSLGTLAVSAGCSPGVRARGSVHAVDPGCIGSDQVPLAGARIAFHCPNRPVPLLEVTTDERGQFEVRRDGLLAEDCWIRISMPGHDDQIYPVSHVCAVRGTVREGCHALAVQAELERQPREDDASPGGY